MSGNTGRAKERRKVKERGILGREGRGGNKVGWESEGSSLHLLGVLIGSLSISSPAYAACGTGLPRGVNYNFREYGSTQGSARTPLLRSQGNVKRHTFYLLSKIGMYNAKN